MIYSVVKKQKGDLPDQKETQCELEDWSSSLQVPFDRIAKQLNAIDHISFRSVCKTWRSSSAKRAKIPFVVSSKLSDANYIRDISILDLFTKEIIPLRTAVSTITSDLFSRDCVYLGGSFGWIALAVEKPKERIILLNLAIHSRPS
ncbi:hypothetical protein J5N97_016665 [Dioscorea zingiberensis]|uniref:F-box domain-containing protein n=1 Tax=Dioscorea zingiberensis TaxID=325984 RepID=A0A9D5HFM5_9LILI|nr:hypothetical protein J5N97_016665 [Dioscorea zingiberensis]